MERKEELKQKEVKILKCIKCGKEYIFDGKRGQSVNLGIFLYSIPKAYLRSLSLQNFRHDREIIYLYSKGGGFNFSLFPNRVAF